MDRELTSVLGTLKQKTKISVDVYSQNFNYLYSSGEKTPFCAPEHIADGVQDVRQNATVFKFRFKKDVYYGVIKGSGEVEKNYALFICGHLESSGLQDDTLSKGDFLRGIVFGECSSMQIIKFMRKFSVPSVPCYVMLIVSESGRSDEICEFLESYSINGTDCAVAVSDESCIFVKFVTSESEAEYQSSYDFADIFCRSLYEETGLKVNAGVGGTVKNLSEAALSYQQAASALNISKIFASKAQVHSYKEYILYKMLEEIPSSKLAYYYNMLVDSDAKTVLADSDMVSTAEEFLENSLNVSETSRKLFMHRNTLMYRLDKIDRATGLDVRNFSDAVTFRLITLLYKLLGKQ